MGGRGGFLPGGPVTSVALFALFAVTLVVLAIVFYKLYQKAGLSGPIGLLMLVPVVNLGVALYLAFAEWPVLAELDRVKLLAASGTVPPPAAPAPVDPTESAVPLTS
jgi:ABC-type spermidine/putrescine transport system permease subunit II